ncbi:deoxycytidylate deaminase [Diplogelasinospora grovesii]|uniref:Deoxycytidylate deaminase n=1 Tax=Diplogelasinospora grovesii TaxID=303347 RepID=A0AAN6NIX7_9PEZI|nr:deoxycytidylate deaminase [Diplogelasinospora grovesii]
MFIGICGSICAGRKTVAQYLVDHHNFTCLHLESKYRRHTENGDATPNDAAGEETSVEEHATVITRRLQEGGQKHLNEGPDPKRQQSHPRSEHNFPTPEALLEFVTRHWRDRWVTVDLPDEAVLDMYSRRPFFLLISVDAPLTVRWQRFKRVNAYHPEYEGATLDFFVELSDELLYDPLTGQLPFMSRATVRLLNTSLNLAHLYATLGKLDLLNPDRLRPSWDTYFMALASLAAQRSNCMKRRVGAVVVRDKRVISTGYNGTPRGLKNCGEGGCGRCNQGQGSGHGLATCLCIHAEENALLEAGRERLDGGSRDKGVVVLYCDTCPCLTCSIKIVQVGISEVVYSQGYSMDGETAAVFREAGVKLRQFVPPANGLIHLEKMELYR